MKIQILSDLHLEFKHKKLPQISDEADVLIFAGDTSSLPEQYGIYFESLRKRTSAPIVVVLGNHEFYHHMFEDAVDFYREYVEDIPDLYLLDNESVEIDGVKFVGTTLWTDFDKGRCEFEAFRYMNDFECILTLDEERKLSTIVPNDMVNKFNENVRFLEREVDSGSVVISHHGPSFACVSEAYKGSRVNGAYFSELSNFILERNPKLWAYGHTHTHNVIEIGDTKVVCNPYGYPSEEYVSYVQNYIVEI